MERVLEVMKDMPVCETLSPEEFAHDVAQFNRTYKKKLKVDFADRKMMCQVMDQIAQQQMATSQRDAIKQNMSDRLVARLKIPPHERTEEDVEAIEALRIMGADEASASPNGWKQFVALNEVKPPRRRAPVDPAKQIQRTAKAMATRVLQSHAFDARGKTGKPLVVSQLRALHRYVDKHPEVADLEQVDAALRVLDYAYAE